jgi:protein-tyrosine phosphatase
MPRILSWSDESAQQVTQEAVQALERGELVGLPTETVYGLAASALNPEAVERLRHGKGRQPGKPLAVALSSGAAADEWVPNMSTLGRRLVRRCWPGPVTLVFGSASEGAAGRLPAAVQEQVCPTGSVGLRVPEHPAAQQTLRSAGPLVLTSANRAGDLPATTADGVVAALGDDVSLVIDGGPCRHGRASTVVSVGANSWQMLREGVVTSAEMQRLAACTILFVCTGNTCRSPMAEAICKRLLADRLGCPPEQLLERGFCVLSAGLTAMMGRCAAAEAVETVLAHGADLERHQSQIVTPELLAGADYVWAMTETHLRLLKAVYPDFGPQPELLSPEGEDVEDPIGCDLEVYRQCAGAIRNHLVKRLEGVLA